MRNKRNGAQWGRRKNRAQCGEEEKWGTMGKKIDSGFNVGEEDKFGFNVLKKRNACFFLIERVAKRHEFCTFWRRL